MLYERVLGHHFQLVTIHPNTNTKPHGNTEQKNLPILPIYRLTPGTVTVKYTAFCNKLYYTLHNIFHSAVLYCTPTAHVNNMNPRSLRSLQVFHHIRT